MKNVFIGTFLLIVNVSLAQKLTINRYVEDSESGLKKATFTAKKGDLLIWQANLLHGAEPLIDKSSTRKSMMFHHCGKHAIYYREITQWPTLKTKFGETIRELFT